MAISKEYSVASFNDLVTFAIAFLTENGFTVEGETEFYGPILSGGDPTSLKRRKVTKGNNIFWFGYCPDYKVVKNYGTSGQLYLDVNYSTSIFTNGIFVGPVVPDFSAAGKQNCSVVSLFMAHGINFPAVLRMHLLANDSLFIAVRCEQNVWKYLYSGFIDASISGQGLIPIITGSGAFAVSGGYPNSMRDLDYKDKGFFGTCAYADTMSTTSGSYRAYEIDCVFMYFDAKWNTIQQQSGVYGFVPLGLNASANSWIRNSNRDFIMLTFYSFLLNNFIENMDNNSLTGFSTLFEFLVFRSSAPREVSSPKAVPFYLYGGIPDIFLCPPKGLVSNQDLILGNDHYKLFDSVPYKKGDASAYYSYDSGPFFAVKAN